MVSKRPASEQLSNKCYVEQSVPPLPVKAGIGGRGASLRWRIVVALS